jgi:DNA polymerase III alpha subunit
MRNFPSFHGHPQSLDSASTPEAFVKKEKELGTGVLTCTDHGTLAAACKIYTLAKKNDLTPLINLEGYFRDDNCPILNKLGVLRTDTVPRGQNKDNWKLSHPNGSFFDYNKYYHVTLGFRDYDAYLKGVKLLSEADKRAELHGSERKSLFTWNDLEELSGTNTIIGSGCLVGMVGRHLIRSNSSSQLKVDAAKAYFDRMNSMFKGRFYVELFPHVCSHDYVKGIFIEVLNEKEKRVDSFKYYYGKTLRVDGKELKAEELAEKWNRNKIQYIQSVKNYRVWQDFEEPLRIVSIKKQDGFIQNECTAAAPGGDIQWGVNYFTMGMAKKHNIPIIISDDFHFDNPQQKIVQDVRLAQASISYDENKKAVSGSWKFYGSYHRQSSEEAFNYFKGKFNTSEKEFEGWVDNAYALVETYKNFKFDTTLQIPTRFFPNDTLAHTKKLIKKHGRMPNDPIYIERLKKEIELFYNNGTADILPYFFIDEEVCRLYSNQGVLTGCGRGSAAGCLLSYLLNITQVDPLKYNLSLDRFLTLDRIKSGSWPDIDTDFPYRDLLTGQECQVIEIEAEDGTKHILPEDFKLETKDGQLKTTKQIIQDGDDIEPWWNNEHK